MINREQVSGTLAIIKDHFGKAIFHDHGRFKGTLADVLTESDDILVRNLLRIAVCELRAYERIEKAKSENNLFIVGTLVSEMFSKYGTGIDVAQVIVECIADLVGYQYHKTQVTNKTSQKVPINKSNPTPISTSTGNKARSDVIGSLGPAGGHIFYDKGSLSDDWRYMEVAPTCSEFNAEWGTYRLDVADTQMTIGSGKKNTELIIEKLSRLGESGRATQMCKVLNINGFSDWFLPSKDELNLVYEELHKRSIGGFGQGTNEVSWMNWFYWSSSQGYTDNAWYQCFASGYQGSNYKNYRNRVRAVRCF
jgi:hypothetical protein